MRGRICGFLICIVVAGSAFSASSQASKNRTANIHLDNPTHDARLPYTAQYKTIQVRTLADGTTITRETTEVVAVDSQGRRMTATTTVPWQRDQAPATHFTVIDPMTHTKISWASPGMEATVAGIPIPAVMQCAYMTASTEFVTISSCRARMVQRRTFPFVGSIAKRLRFFGMHRSAGLGSCAGMAIPITKTTHEDLGTETIHGVEARGWRTTTTKGLGITNIQPQATTFEVWTAIDPGLRGLVARQVNDNSPWGKTTKELMRFSQTEPEPSFFRVPPGYEIVNREVSMDNCPSAEEMEPAAAPAP